MDTKVIVLSKTDSFMPTIPVRRRIKRKKRKKIYKALS